MKVKPKAYYYTSSSNNVRVAELRIKSATDYYSVNIDLLESRTAQYVTDLIKNSKSRYISDLNLEFQIKSRNGSLELIIEFYGQDLVTLLIAYGAIKQGLKELSKDIIWIITELEDKLEKGIEYFRSKNLISSRKNLGILDELKDVIRRLDREKKINPSTYIVSTNFKSLKQNYVDILSALNVVRGSDAFKKIEEEFRIKFQDSLPKPIRKNVLKYINDFKRSNEDN